MKINHRVSLSEYKTLDTFKDEDKNAHYETQYIDEEILALAIEFYNGYFGYYKNPIDREEALAYASLGVRANADLWKSMMPMNRDKIDHFYKTTPLYFFHDRFERRDRFLQRRKVASVVVTVTIRRMNSPTPVMSLRLE